MILLYHHVAPIDSIPGTASAKRDQGWEFAHSPDSFEFQMRELRRRGYHFISLGQLVDAIRATGREPAGSVVVTFDDGWIDNYIFAFPLLKKMEIPAAFFVVTGHLRDKNSDAFRMNGGQLRELAAQGMTIGSHTRTHPDLARISDADARNEIAGSKADLENVLGGPVEYLAYPGGGFNARVAAIARESGYRAACSVLGPKANDAASLYWLYRDLLSPTLDTLGDRYRLSRIARKALAFRVNKRLKRRLAAPQSNQSQP